MTEGSATQIGETGPSTVAEVPAETGEETGDVTVTLLSRDGIAWKTPEQMSDEELAAELVADERRLARLALKPGARYLTEPQLRRLAGMSRKRRQIALAELRRVERKVARVAKRKGAK